MEKESAVKAERPKLTWPLLKRMFDDSPAEIARGCLQSILAFGGSVAPLTPEEENEVFAFLLEVGDEKHVTVSDIVLRREARNVLARKFLPPMQFNGKKLPDGNIYGRRLMSVLNFWARSGEHEFYSKNKEYGELVDGVFRWALVRAKWDHDLADALARALVTCERYEILRANDDVCALAIPPLFFECLDRMDGQGLKNSVPDMWFQPGVMPFGTIRKEEFCFRDLHCLRERDKPEFVSVENVARWAMGFDREAGQTLLILLHAWLRKNSYA